MSKDTHKITKAQALKIYKAACNNWKSVIANTWFEEFAKSSSRNIEVTKAFYNSMYTASNSDQKVILQEIFKGVFDEVLPEPGTLVAVKDHLHENWEIAIFVSYDKTNDKFPYRVTSNPDDIADESGYSMMKKLTKDQITKLLP